MPALTRGPLPARVYWVRRTMVLTTAVLLVVAIARMLGGGSDASSGSDPAAALVADGSPTVSATLTDEASAHRTAREPGKRASRSKEPKLAQPQGPCSNDDIAVTPLVEDAVGGHDVPITLQLRTQVAEACTWRVSPGTVTVNITSGKDRIWTSRDCPASIETRDVIVRRAVTTDVTVVWREARRSKSDGCTRSADWALPGWYHVTAAALGGEPSDLQFELTAPAAATITKTAKPKNSPSSSPSTSPSGRPVAPDHGSTKSPSGAVEPD